MTRPTRDKMADHARGLASIVLDMIECRAPVTVADAARRMGASDKTARRMLLALEAEIGAHIQRRARLRPDAFPELTRSERLIVDALAAMPGRFATVEMLIGELDAPAHGIVTVRQHVSNIRKKGVPVLTDTNRGYALQGGLREKYETRERQEEMA